MNIYSYFFAIIFLFCEFLYLRLVNEYKDNDLKNIIYKYVKYPFYLIDCFIWISLAFIIYNNKILYFTIIKIFYNVYSAFEQYIEDRGINREIPNRNDYDFENHINQKIIFPFIL